MVAVIDVISGRQYFVLVFSVLPSEVKDACYELLGATARAMAFLVNINVLKKSRNRSQTKE